MFLIVLSEPMYLTEERNRLNIRRIFTSWASSRWSANRFWGSLIYRKRSALWRALSQPIFSLQQRWIPTVIQGWEPRMPAGGLEKYPWIHRQSTLVWIILHLLTLCKTKKILSCMAQLVLAKTTWPQLSVLKLVTKVKTSSSSVPPHLLINSPKLKLPEVWTSICDKSKMRFAYLWRMGVCPLWKGWSPVAISGYLRVLWKT